MSCGSRLRVYFIEICTRGGSTTTAGEERSNKKAVAPVEVSPREEKCEKSLSQLCCVDMRGRDELGDTGPPHHRDSDCEALVRPGIFRLVAIGELVGYKPCAILAASWWVSGDGQCRDETQ